MTEAEKSIIAQALAILDSHLKKSEFLFTSPDAVRNYVRLHLQEKENEHFGALYLNNENRLIEFEIHHMGTLSRTEVHPRELVKTALRHNAAAVILVHNHPSGSTLPSRQDVEMTVKIKNTLAMVDVGTLDHLIVCKNEIVSLAEIGKL